MNKTTLAGWITMIFVFFIPFVGSRHLFFGAVNSKYFYVLGSISLIALVAAGVMVLRKPQICARGRWFLLSLGLVLLIQYIATFWGVFPIRSLFSDIIRSSGVLFLTGVGFVSLLLSELLTARDWQLVRRAVAISGAIFSSLTILGSEGLGLTGRIFSVINLDISGLTFGNSTFAGAYLVLALIITLIEVVRSLPQSRTRKIFSLLALAQLLSPLLVSFSSQVLGSARASGATAILIILFLVGWHLLRLFWPQDSKKYALGAWGGLFVVGIMVSVGLLFVSGSWVQEKYIEASSAARLVVWEVGLEAFKEKPLLGWGPENFRLAFEKQFDNRLYQDEYLGEIWFDRAHNLIVDTLVSVGAVGAASIILFAVFFVIVIVRAGKLGLVGDEEALLLSVIPLAHFLQLQTAFDTVGTYALGGIIVGYVLWLEKQVVGASLDPKTIKVSSLLRYVLAIISMILFVGSFYMLVVEYGRQQSLYKIFITQNNDQQLKLVDMALSRSDTEALRLSSASMIRGLLSQIAEDGSNPNLGKIGLDQLSTYEEHFKDYLKQAPEDYRIRINYSYLLMIKTILGENRIEDSRKIIEDSYVLSPNNPLTYAMHALTYLYEGKIKQAKEKVNEGIALNPQIEFSRQVLGHIVNQEKQFPTINVLKLENL